jgi:CDP-paratose 2-epimerase
LKTVLVTGGCGFVGSSLALSLKLEYPSHRIIAFDNLKRRGSELNIKRLQLAGIEFIHGDIRKKEDIVAVGSFDILIEAAAEPSVLAGINQGIDYLVDTNLVGTLYCLDIAARYGAQVIFLSTSRVYPIPYIDKIRYTESDTRFVIQADQELPGVSEKGISEQFPTDAARSFYGASKLASELFLLEYCDNNNLKAVINRCGVLTGPWQMGKVDQGVVVLWMARHYWKGKLGYFGYGGTGKQVRDFLHVDDLYSLVKIQLEDVNTYSGNIYNVGGGVSVSASLQELTAYCQKITGNTIEIGSVKENRAADIPVYISDNTKISTLSGWQPTRSVETILTDIYQWLVANEADLKPILSL